MTKPFPETKRKRFVFEWCRKLGNATCPYLIRWVFSTPFGSIRLHHWIASDDKRATHDHGWWFWTLVLSGGYTDVSDEGHERMTRGRLRFRPAEHQHTVEVDKGGCWTLVLTGPEFRFWGFWVRYNHEPANTGPSPRCKHCGLNEGYWKTFVCKRRFKKANKYFIEHGHHPCAT